MFIQKLEKLIEEIISSTTISEYHCRGCNGIVSRTTQQCPHCGIFLAYIECMDCGFLGPEDAFSDDICPECGGQVNIQEKVGCLGWLLNIRRNKEEKELERLFGKYGQIVQKDSKNTNERDLR